MPQSELIFIAKKDGLHHFRYNHTNTFLHTRSSARDHLRGITNDVYLKSGPVGGSLMFF